MGKYWWRRAEKRLRDGDGQDGRLSLLSYSAAEPSLVLHVRRQKDRQKSV